LELGEQIGRARIRERIAALVARCVERVMRAGLEVHGPRSADERAGIVSFRTPGDPQEVFRRLHRQGYSIALREGLLRVAPHVYNSNDEVDAVFERILSAS
jgi:selenocysteine lyase/cysteine desulfurase